MHVFVLGYPSYVGGADTELWHTVRLWRQFGLEVTVVPTWHANADQRVRLDRIGVRTCEVSGANSLSRVPGLSGSIVVSFCNGEFLKSAEMLNSIGCRLVWVNCMTWVFPAEIAYCEKHGPFSAYVFQSDYQRQMLTERYAQFGAQADQFHLIHGAFAWDEFEFAPLTHRAGEPFVIGRIARDDLDKWSSNLWPIYTSVLYAQKRARVMAWSDRLAKKCGPAPQWAETLKANAEPAQTFFSTLHCLFPINGGAGENWPRAGLEAMAAGVPIVAQRQWGWCEMIEHGVTGFLGGDDCELAYYVSVLAHDEALRLRIAVAARQRLASVLADPQQIWERWKQVFERLT